MSVVQCVAYECAGLASLVRYSTSSAREGRERPDVPRRRPQVQGEHSSLVLVAALLRIRIAYCEHVALSPRAERGQGAGASARIPQDDRRARAALLVRRDWSHHSCMLRFTYAYHHCERVSFTAYTVYEFIMSTYSYVLVAVSS